MTHPELIPFFVGLLLLTLLIIDVGTNGQGPRE